MPAGFDMEGELAVRAWQEGGSAASSTRILKEQHRQHVHDEKDGEST